MVVSWWAAVSGSRAWPGSACAVSAWLKVPLDAGVTIQAPWSTGVAPPIWISTSASATWSERKVMKLVVASAAVDPRVERVAGTDHGLALGGQPGEEGHEAGDRGAARLEGSLLLVAEVRHRGD